MKKPKKTPVTGEITRSFIKHKVYGTVYAIEGDDTGTVLLGALITQATACRHTLAGYDMTLLTAVDIELINRDLRDFEVFEPVCSDPGHLLEENRGAGAGVSERAARVSAGARHGEGSEGGARPRGEHAPRSGA